MKTDYDVAIVGGGIVGLAHAWMASERGFSVVLCERTARAEGASVRNFGMIWPIGQPEGDCYEIALSSRSRWLQLKERNVLEVEECGSLHVAHHEDELAVLEEFRDLGNHDIEIFSAAETLSRSCRVNPQGLKGGMWSATELRVDPRTASARIAGWLAESMSVDCRFGTPIVRVQDGALQTADGRQFKAERIIVCSGSDLQSLYPGLFATSGLKLCKLQMLKAATPVDYQPGMPHIASGLTLRHYTSFEKCSSLQRLKDRIASETPKLDRYGIHVMSSEFSGGLILGDSHEYGEDITPFDKHEIDELMLRELRKVLRLENWTITERWHGIYAKHPERVVFEADVEEGVKVFVGPGGAGMSMSFGLAERAWKHWMGED